MQEPKMPKDWNDARGWEKYYVALRKQSEEEDIWLGPGSITLDRLPALAAELKQKNGKAVWIPGCGLSDLPLLFSYMGFEVHATDISPTAVAYQEIDDEGKLRKRLPPDLIAPEKGALICAVQDFRQSYLENYFDMVINVKAFQGFPPETMKQIAHVHYKAMKPDRYAFFDTMNVQGERRDDLEASLVEAGFYIPYYELHRWYRQRLRETGIQYVFILGQPMVPFSGSSARSKRKREQDMEVLRSITEEFHQRAEKEQEAESKRRTLDARTAIIIYSTG